MAHSRPVLPHDAVGQELLPPVAYAPVLAAGQLVERCHEPAEVAARSSCGAFQPLVPNRTERQRICWPTSGPALLAGRLRARSGRVAASMAWPRAAASATPRLGHATSSARVSSLTDG